MTTLVNAVQPENVLLGIEVTALGITTLVKPDTKKTPLPKVVTVLGIVTLVMRGKWANALDPMLVTELPMSTLVK